jgi:hypothetical protein
MLNVGGVPFSFRVRSSGWESFGDISINKSIVGPQGAEAIVFWTSFPDGDIADPCFDVLGPRAGRSTDDLAAAVAAAPGTELVTAPSDVTVGGLPADRVVVIVREHAGCAPGYFFRWEDVEAGAFWTRSGAGSTIRVWIVDVGGTFIVVEAATSEQADADLVDEVHRIVRSIRFEALFDTS